MSLITRVSSWSGAKQIMKTQRGGQEKRTAFRVLGRVFEWPCELESRRCATWYRRCAWLFQAGSRCDAVINSTVPRNVNHRYRNECQWSVFVQGKTLVRRRYAGWIDRRSFQNLASKLATCFASHASNLLPQTRSKLQRYRFLNRRIESLECVQRKRICPVR